MYNPIRPPLGVPYHSVLIAINVYTLNAQCLRADTLRFTVTLIVACGGICQLAAVFRSAIPSPLNKLLYLWYWVISVGMF